MYRAVSWGHSRLFSVFIHSLSSIYVPCGELGAQTLCDFCVLRSCLMLPAACQTCVFIYISLRPSFCASGRVKRLRWGGARQTRQTPRHLAIIIIWTFLFCFGVFCFGIFCCDVVAISLFFFNRRITTPRCSRDSSGWCFDLKSLCKGSTVRGARYDKVDGSCRCSHLKKYMLFLPYDIRHPLRLCGELLRAGLRSESAA